MLNDPLANAMSLILNVEKTGKSECEIKPVSKVIKDVLSIMKDKQFIGEFKEIKDSKGGFIKINLIGNINKCSAIKPRFSVKSINFEKYEKRYLPAKDVGIIFVSTAKGIMPNDEAKKKKLGGRLLAYCY